MEAAAKSASWKMELEAGFQYEAAREMCSLPVVVPN